VGNVLYKGHDSREDLAMVADRGDAYLLDNAAFDKNGQSLELTRGKINILPDMPTWPADFQALPSGEVEHYVVSHAGARPKDRDEIDKRIIQDFLDRKGGIIDSQEEVGGYPNHKKTSRKLEIPAEDIEEWLLKLAAELE
jgi:hypothetical protein